MKCPVCPDALLLMSERQGIEIEYCPQCRGIWLDRGELEKLLERSLTLPSSSAPSRPVFIDHDDRPRHHSPHSRRSWLSEFFD